MKIEHSTALVTGSNRGIGRATVEALLSRGAAKVYAAARRPSSLDELARLDPRVVPLGLDLTDPDAIGRSAVLAGDVTILINNGGSLAFADPLDGDLAAFEADLRTNLFGALSLTRALAPVIERNGGGAIVNLLSLVVFGSVPAMGGYSASKAAAASVTQALRAQLAQKQITVHGVFPGAVDTDLIRAVEMPKTSPAAVATAILDGVEAGEENIFPDPMARQGYLAWRSDPAAFERRMAAI